DLIRRTHRVVVTGVALLAFGLIGSLVCLRLRLTHDVNGRLRALQRAGLPTSGAELNCIFCRPCLSTLPTAHHFVTSNCRKATWFTVSGRMARTTEGWSHPPNPAAAMGSRKTSPLRRKTEW